MLFNSENQMEHLVKKRQWEKINKKLPSANAEARLALATACGGLSDENASNILINLLKDSDENVLLQVVKSLGNIGRDNAKTHLQALFDRLPENDTLMKNSIRESISKINVSKRQ